MSYRGPQVYQFFFITVTSLPSLNKGITLPYLDNFIDMYMYETHVSNFTYNQHTSSNKSQHSIRQPLYGMTLTSVHLKEESSKESQRKEQRVARTNSRCESQSKGLKRSPVRER